MTALRLPEVGDTVQYHGSLTDHHGEAVVTAVNGWRGWLWFSIRLATGVKLHKVSETSLTVTKYAR